MLEEVLELICFLGPLLSFFIAFRLCNIKRSRDSDVVEDSKLFLNRMFLIYFTLDGIVGGLEVIYLFKINQERFNVSNCVTFITIWMSSMENRVIFNFCLVFCRFLYVRYPGQLMKEGLKLLHFLIILGWNKALSLIFLIFMFKLLESLAALEHL